MHKMQTIVFATIHELLVHSISIVLYAAQGDKGAGGGAPF
jgi:hypothetical protein